MSNPLVYGLAATVVIIGAAALFISGDSSSPFHANWERGLLMGFANSLKNGRQPDQEPLSHMSTGQNLPLIETEVLTEDQYVAKMRSNNNKLAGSRYYEPGHGLLGLTPPPKPHQWIAYTCTYLPPESTLLSFRSEWQYAEVTFRQGVPQTIDFTAVSKPTPAQLSECETLEDFRKQTYRLPMMPGYYNTLPDIR